jgi:transcriptional regulator with XRE-family HTH domain
MQNFETFGQRLRRLRLERGWQIVELGKKARISAHQISEYERGKHFPNFWKLVEVANALDVSLDYLYLGDLNEKATRSACADVPASGERGLVVPV